MKNSPTASRFLGESYPCASHRSGIGDPKIVALEGANWGNWGSEVDARNWDGDLSIGFG